MQIINFREPSYAPASTKVAIIFGFQRVCFREKFWDAEDFGNFSKFVEAK